MEGEGFSVLCADIGGTNGRLQLWTIKGESEKRVLSLKSEKDYRMALFSDHLSLFKVFLEESNHQKVDACSLALAGVISNNGRKNGANNLFFSDGTPWPHLLAETIEEGLGIKTGNVIFVNDFEAIGYSIALLKSKTPFLSHIKQEISNSLVHLSSVPGEEAKPMACLGAGTGLGAVYLTYNPDKHTYQVHPSEGGMVNTFCPESDKEYQLLKFVQSKYGTFLEIERFVSGPGLVNIFEFLAQDPQVAQESKEIIQEVFSADPDLRAAVIAKYAQQGNATCLEALDLFIDIYARTATTLACTFLPYSGLFIAGGVFPKIEWRASQPKPGRTLSRFIERFLQAHTLSEIMATIPVTVLTSGRVGLWGALYRGLSLLSLE
eukprot:TRINITY_DN23409_c0_g1_i1.p1 TRINITY_DN23409_c0_g1~~TRINITY_DN23409_c0_g1_i1.p1  ORF type:complete len:378 (-),score=70.41 TRINITY_DN23409_c0_g1_i1:29-1162(-)